MRADQEIDRRHLSQALIRDEKGNLGTGIRQISQHGQRSGSRGHASNPVVGIVPPT